MELSRQLCRICLSESEFNVSLFGSFCRKTNIIDKILVCLKLVIEETDTMDTICYKCAENVERYYDFIMFVKKCQMKLAEPRQVEASVSRRHVTSYVREQVFDDDYTFSFLLEPPEDKKPKQSSPFFSYFTPPPPKPKKASEPIWKTPYVEKHEKRDAKLATPRNEPKRKSRQNSRDLFESQSQEAEDPKSLDWNLTPVENILKQVRDKCFGRSNY